MIKSCYEEKEGSGSVLITHYADLLKYICKNYLGWNGEKDEAGREMLQHIGTDIVRKQNPDFWANFMADILTFFKDYWKVVVVPDVRFPNEIDKLKLRGSLGGFSITHMHINRPNFVNALTEKQRQHKSENAMNNIKAGFYIENSGDLEELKGKITNWVKENLFT